MQRLFLLLMMAVLLGSPSRSPAAPDDQTRVTLELVKAPLSEALRQIDKQSDADIIFADTLVAGITVTRQLRNASIEQALRIVLDHTPLTYQLSQAGRYVIIRRPVIPRTTLTGQIVDAQRGEALPYATVWIQDTELLAQADTEGHFTLVDVPAVSSMLQGALHRV